MFLILSIRPLNAVAALVVAALFWVDVVDVRAEGSPNRARGEVHALMWHPATVAASSMAAPNRAEQPAGSLGGLFNRPSLLGGFAAGFLGAGLVGWMFGYGVYGELGSVASYIGLLFQFALLVMLGRLIWIWWNGRNAPAFAGLSPRQLADPYLRSRRDANADAAALSGTEAAETEENGSGVADPNTLALRH
jgi:predicted lipid-binding transport protein (Tim44 family)